MDLIDREPGYEQYSDLEYVTIKAIQELNKQISEVQSQFYKLDEERKILLQRLDDYKNTAKKERELIDRWKRISIEEFFKLEVKNGFFIFSTDSCDMCKEHLRNVSEPDIVRNTAVIELLLEEDKENMRNKVDNFKATPFTALYKDNEQIDFRFGQLYFDDWKELLASYRAGKKVPVKEEDEI